MERNAAILASVSFFVITMAANGQPAFQGANEGPGANQIVDTGPVAARGLGLGLGGPAAQLMIPRTPGAAPTLSCGALSTVDANATNMAGTVTVTSSATASCVITFVPAFQSFNHCLVGEEHGGSTFSQISYSYSLTSITATGTSLSGTLIDYSCSGY